MENKNAIPHVIHYCWFGGNPLPESAQRCINSWKKFLPEHEIKCWDETNYDIYACQYVQEAYAAKKWAFVSDYARFDILYKHGGLYFDVDVELIAPIDDILEKGPFWGMERNLEQQATVNPGLGMAAPAGLPVYATILEHYQNSHFLNADGTYDYTTIVMRTTDVLLQFGLQKSVAPQLVADVWVYPWDYFCPIMYQTGEQNITANTRSIHHYDSSWLLKEDLHLKRIKMILCKKFGKRWASYLVQVYSFPFRVKKKVTERGIAATMRFAIDKLFTKKS